jgi:hypothetical protein
MKAWGLAIAAIFWFAWFASPAFPQLQTQPAGQGPTGATSSSVSVATTSTKVSLTQPSNYITIANPSSNSNTVYFSETSPVASTNGCIYAGSVYNYAGVPLSSFYLISPSGSETVTVIAH